MAKHKRPLLSDGNCQRCGHPLARKAGLHVCPKCGHTRSLDYEANPYYSRLSRFPPAEGIQGGSRKLPTNSED